MKNSLSKHRVVITDYNFASLDIERSVLEPLGIEISAHQCKTLEQLQSETLDAVGLLNQYFGPLGEELFKNCPRLRMIVRYGIGVDTIDIPAATRYGIMVSNVPEFCLEEVSDHAAALILNLARKISVAMDASQKGQYPSVEGQSSRVYRIWPDCQAHRSKVGLLRPTICLL